MATESFGISTRPQTGMRRVTVPRRRITAPDTSPSAVPETRSSESGPGTVIVGGTSISVPSGVPLNVTDTVHSPAPPPTSSTATLLLVIVSEWTRPNETAVGVGRIAGASAAATSTRPAPARVGPTCPSPPARGFAVAVSAALTSAGLQLGWRWRRSATAPETWGAAMLVPDDRPQPPGCEERIDVPGATTSGFRRSEIGVGPADEKLAMDGEAVDVVAPTVIAATALPGDPTEPRPKSSKSFPAATTGTTPAAAAASSASATMSRDGSISGSPSDRLITSMPSATAASIAATISGAFPLRPSPDRVGTVSAL